MSKLRIHIEKSGIYTTVVGTPNYDYMDYGVPVGGAMDQVSSALANRIIGLSEDTNLFEFTLIGPTLRFEGTAICALSGSEMNARLNDSPLKRFTPFWVQTGDILTLGKSSKGFRAYLAVSAKLSLTQKNFIARRLDKGEIIATSVVKTSLQDGVIESKLDLSNEIELLRGPEFTSLTDNQIEDLQKGSLVIAPTSNRMSYVFQTEILTPPTSFPSSAILPGCVQITPSGQLNVLMRDAQTTGGYPRIGVLTETSINRLAQKRPGETIQFRFLDEKAVTSSEAAERE